MQDKEFDQLFNSKLNDFEVEPSAKVWQNITRDLDGKKAKRSIVPYLSIAASVIVLASVSLLFFNKTAEKPDQPKLVKIKPVKPLSAADTNERPVAIDSVEDDTYLKEEAVAGVAAKKPLPASKAPQVEHIKQEATVIPPEPIAQKPEPVLAVVPAEKPALLQPVAPGTDIGLGTATLANHQNEINEIQPGAVVNDPAPEKTIVEKTTVKKRGIHSLGGLINAIVARVDKRDDKLIEFTDDSNDDGSRLTGVNLGIFKVKKQ